MAFLTHVLPLALLLIVGVSSMVQTNEGSALAACYNSSSSYNGSNIEECSKAFRLILENTGKLLNFTEDQINYVWSLEREMQGLFHKRRRVRRQAGQQFQLPVRRECRLLSPIERFHLFGAIRDLKYSLLGPTSEAENEYDTLANLHRGMELDVHAHRGSNFLGWHRVYVVFYELALRRKRYWVTLCFWDTTFEYNLGMAAWRDSAVFSSSFWGNRRGTVITGPFAFWRMPRGLQGMGPFLTRDVGVPGSGMPVDTRAAHSIFYNSETRRHTQVTQGGSGFDTITNSAGVTRPIVIEFEHNNVHNFVGRAMSLTDSAPQDPVFFFHHCYVDYMWEKFREKMKFLGEVPSTDYPGHGASSHAEDYPMIGFEWLRNIDGYSDYFTAFLYRYETPTCLACLHSTYATCNPHGMCVARTISPWEITDGPWHPGTEPGTPPMAAFESTPAESSGFAALGGEVQTTMGRRFPIASSSE